MTLTKAVLFLLVIIVLVLTGMVLYKHFVTDQITEWNLIGKGIYGTIDGTASAILTGRHLGRHPTSSQMGHR